MTALVQRVARNPRGRDYAVGDIHGHFSRLAAALENARFDPARDRLFSVGDLVDRGPECEAALDWLARPWFYAVRGNHEDVAIRYARGNPVDRETYSRNGGDWFMALAPDRQQAFAAAFNKLPYVLEVDTAQGRIGIVHADCPRADWNSFTAALSASRPLRDRCLWERRRIQAEDTSGVANIRAVVVGHTPLDTPRALGNVHHIDTGGWMPHGYFTLLDLATLDPVIAADASNERRRARYDPPVPE